MVEGYVSGRYLVEEFHYTYGQEVRLEPTIDVPEANLRSSLIAEEGQEFDDAYMVYDVVEMVDALADLVYVAYGAALTYGVDADRSIDGYVFVPIDSLTTDGRYLSKSVYLEKANLNTFINQPWNIFISDSVQGYWDAIRVNDIDAIEHAITVIIARCYQVAANMGVDLDEILDEVQKSNMSKLEDGKVLRREDGKILKGKYFFTPDIMKILKKQRVDF